MTSIQSLIALFLYICVIFPCLCATETHPPQFRLAICYWGLQRSSKFVYESHAAQVHEPLHKAGIPFDIYLHTWYSKEFWVVDKRDTVSTANNTDWTYLRPNVVQVDSQDEFLQNISFSEFYYAHEKHNEWLPQLLNNHLCALESQKRVTNMCLSANKNYTHIMFLRPDVRVQSPLPVESIFSTKFDPKAIYIPNYDHYEGYNDRFAVVHAQNVLWYSHRIDFAPRYRREHGRIISEKYVKFVVDSFYSPVFIDFKFIRVRSDGREEA